MIDNNKSPALLLSCIVVWGIAGAVGPMASIAYDFLMSKGVYAPYVEIVDLLWPIGLLCLIFPTYICVMLNIVLYIVFGGMVWSLRVRDRRYHIFHYASLCVAVSLMHGVIEMFNYTSESITAHLISFLILFTPFLLLSIISKLYQINTNS